MVVIMQERVLLLVYQARLISKRQSLAAFSVVKTEFGCYDY